MQPLTSLPREILEDILSNLDYQSLSRCLSVCWHLKTTINSSSELTYIIELAQDGMIDNPSMQMSHAERLLRLRDQRKAWNRLDWRSSSVVPIEGLCYAYELVNGVFAKGIGGRDFIVAWLPSVTAKGHRLHRDDLKIRLRDFAMDPGQDLIIFLEEDDGPFNNNRSVTLHVRSILTHEAHSKARYPVLQFTVAPHEVFGAFVRNLFLQVADDIVAVLLSTGSQRLLLWNWREGFLISDSTLVGHGLPTDTLDFSFISPRAYILMCPEGDGSIVIEAFKSEPGFRPLHVASLFLPELQEDARIESLANHTSPFETPSRDEPFTTSPSSRLHVMSIQYDAPDNTSHPHLRLFVHNRTFINFVTSYFAKDFPEPEYALWTEWGPQATRMMETFLPYTWLRYVHGQRVICPRGYRSSRRTMQVMDFNIHPSGVTFDQGSLRIAPSFLLRNGLFKEGVTTCLPYAVAARDCAEEYSAFMIDAQRIIGLKAEGHVDEELKELHVFAF